MNTAVRLHNVYLQKIMRPLSLWTNRFESYIKISVCARANYHFVATGDARW